MKFLVDLHVHTRFSGDSSLDPEEALIQGIKKSLNAIAFTEHYFYEASEPVERLREAYSGRIRIFRGVEFSALEGHCLIFGVNTDRLGLDDAPLADIVRVVNEKGGVVIPSHPYRRGHGMGDVVKEVAGLCAIEGYNGYNMHAYNAKAVSAAEALGLPYTGGSDAHAPEEVGACYTEFDGSADNGELVGMLRRGHYRGVDTRRVSRFTAFRF